MWVLILTVYLAGMYDDSGMAVNRIAVPGFTSYELCERAGRTEQQGSPSKLHQNTGGVRVTTTYHCAKLQ